MPPHRTQSILRTLPRNNMTVRTASRRSASSPSTAACRLLVALLSVAVHVHVVHRADAKLITGLAPCPNGAPPARECLVSVLVDLRAFRARARERENSTRHNNVNSVAEPKDASQDLPAARPPTPSTAAPRDPDPNPQLEQQQRKQQQLEQAVRYQEDELQQLREQVQELRLQLARALQLYQLPPPAVGRLSPGPPPPPVKTLRGPYYQPPSEQSVGSARRFYRTLPQHQQTPVFGQRLSLLGLRELARGEVVVAT